MFGCVNYDLQETKRMDDNQPGRELRGDDPTLGKLTPKGRGEKAGDDLK
jgi:hypothetical protein